MSDVIIRRVEQGDLQALTDIYNHYVRETPISFDIEPRTLAQRQAWLDSFAPAGRYQCFVALKGDQVVGWASSHRYHERAAYDTTVATGIYLSPEVTAQGLGRRLYGTLFEALAGADIHRAFAGITLPNSASVGLHESFGFRLVG
ncbi:MAG TPA: GNAT family N-acetyltransferase, partial [Rhizomicrobium sp.]|nr:GNAT family N-acetyltransferase [Rhizomicrobium sp.]